jgi:alkaline phosphatase D
MSRRAFLGLGGVGAAGLLLGGGLVLSSNRTLTALTFSDYPFTLGVASGDADPVSLVLWTRLAPDTLNGGAMPSNDVEVRWEMAEDENFTDVVQEGTATALSDRAHAVHVGVTGSSRRGTTGTASRPVTRSALWGAPRPPRPSMPL